MNTQICNSLAKTPERCITSPPDIQRGWCVTFLPTQGSPTTRSPHVCLQRWLRPAEKRRSHRTLDSKSPATEILGHGSQHPQHHVSLAIASLEPKATLASYIKETSLYRLALGLLETALQTINRMSVSGLSPHSGGEDRGTGILAIVIVVSVLVALTVALRFATRIWIVRSVGWDDYTILMAAFGEMIGTGLVIVEVHYGLGRHKAGLTQWQYIEFMKYSYGEWIQTFQTLMFTKISICCFLLRIPVKKHLIRPIQGAIAVLIVSNIVLTLLWIFQCNPIARTWNKQTPGRCFTDAQLQRIIVSQALISIISDFGLALFPILLLWKVQIPLSTKAGLCSLMGLGLM